jgi:predicted ArsR family transcriptional regulator
VATRRHLGVLEEDGLVASHRVNQGRGRPVARYWLTEDAQRLFPQRYDALAGEMLEFLADTQGREGLRAYLRWRLEREVEGLRESVTADDLEGRLEQLADALSAAGYEASVEADGEGFTLTQHNCAIYDIAKDHPEMCAYEAATFSKVLGRDVSCRADRRSPVGAPPACAASPPRATTTKPEQHPPRRAVATEKTPVGPRGPADRPPARGAEPSRRPRPDDEESET